MNNKMLKRVSFLIVMLAAPGVLTADEKTKSYDFTLPDVRTGKPVALEARVTVVAFIGTSCPVNNAYMPTLLKLAQQNRERGVQFIAINSNRVETPAEVAEHAKKYELSFPVLKDSQNKVADQFGAKRTPEVFVLDAKKTLVYRGRIDDQFGVDFRRAKATKRDLAEALDLVLSGAYGSEARETEPAGCLITRGVAAKADATVTYTRDVAKIFQKHCQECHRPGQIGPFPLLTFEHAEGWSAMIREVVAEKRMPPWFADPKIGHFRNDRSLPDKDRETLLAWIDQGCPKGDAKDEPPPVQWPEGWRIGKPDVILKMKDEFAVPAEMPRGGVPYKYFTIETNFKEDMWVQKAEAHAGAPEVVHHIIAFILPTLNSDEPVPEGPPLLPLVFPNAKRATILCGTAPGDMPTMLRDGYAKKVPKGAKIILQMHYTPNGRAQKDRSEIGLIFAKEPPKYRVRSLPVVNFRFAIPPGDGNHKVESVGPADLQGANVGFEKEVQIVSFMPHMHLRGKDFYIEAFYPDGKKQPLLSVPRFDFNWQMAYRLAEPLTLPKGTILHCVAHFDNSDKNPNNPDPTKTIYWGDQTWQEMMVGWTDYAVPNK